MPYWCIGCKQHGIIELAQVIEATDFGDLPLCHHCKMIYDTNQVIATMSEAMQQTAQEIANAINALSEQILTLTEQVYKDKARIDALEKRFARLN